MPGRADYARQTEQQLCGQCQEPMTAVSTGVHVTHYKCMNKECTAKGLVPVPRLTRKQREELYNTQSGNRVNITPVTGPLDEGELAGPLNPEKKTRRKSKAETPE